MGMQKFIPFANLVIASWIARLLGWCGASLATFDITLSWTKDAPLHVAQLITGLLLMVANAVISHLNLKAAHGASNTPILPPGVTKAAIAFAILLPFTAITTGCSTNTNLTTNAGQPSATVDNGNRIYPGATVTSANTSAGTKLTSISGTNIVLSPAPLLSGTVPATFKNTVAGQLAGDSKAYTQTVGNMAQTILPQIVAAAGSVAQLTSLIQNTASDWGLSPTNASQRSTLTNIISIAGKVGSDATALTNYFTGVQTTGSTASTNTSFYIPQHDPPDRFYVLKPVARDSAGELVYSF